MKWLLVFPLLLLACAPASTGHDVAKLREQVAVLQAQYRDLQATGAGPVYYELTIGSFTAVHAYGAFSSYDTAAARVKWLKENGYMLEGAPYFIQPRRLNDPLVVIDAGGRP